MYKFSDLLVNAGHSLMDLLPGDSVKLITALNPELESPRKLRGYLENIISAESLLLDKSSRWTLLKLLPEEHAIELCKLLNFNGNEPFSFLKTHSFSSKNHKKILLEFFSLEYKEVEEVSLPSSEKINCGYGLFKHQASALIEIAKILEEKRGRVMLHMPTGSGKTRTAVTFASEFLRKNNSVVIWLASQEELCEQAYGEFKSAWSFLGNRDISSYRFWGKHEKPQNMNEGFVVMGLDKASSTLQKDKKFFTDLPDNKLIIFDEAHQAIARTYKNVTDFLVGPQGNGRLLGLTATPGRSFIDIDKDEELANFFHNKKVTLSVDGFDNPISYLIDSEYLAKPKFINVEGLVDAELSEKDLSNIELGKDLTQDTLTRLGNDEKRNLKIIDKCLDVVQRHKRVIVFAASVAQSNALAVVMSSNGYNAVSISGKSSSEDRTKFIESYKDNSDEHKIIFNYGILTQGFDAPKTSSVIIARPTTSLVLYSQMVGRALRGRRANGNKEAEIYTVKDGGIAAFNSITDAFINWEDVWNDNNE